MLDARHLPKEPGVYLFKDSKGKIIYVGKAKSLRSRVRSYFSKGDHSPKTQLLVSKIKDLDYIVVATEVEALLLENKLIKQHAPKYNISLKDAKTYAYLVMTDEPYPRLLTTRKIKKKGTHFGPYVDGTLRHELQELVVSLFRLRVCRKLPRRACLNYHIGLCSAPCIKQVSKEEYGEQVAAAIRFLKGDTKETVRALEREMREASDNMCFEQALQKRRQLEAIAAIEERQSVDRIRARDQDAIAYLERDGKAHFVVLSLSKGVLRGKREYHLDADENVAEDFLKALYAKSYIPHEILLEKPFLENDEQRKVLERYLSKIKGSTVRILVPVRVEKRSLTELAKKNLEIALKSPVLDELEQKLYLPSPPRTIECFDISNLGKDHIVAGMVQWVDGKPNKEGYRKFKLAQSTQDDFIAIGEAVRRRYKRLLEEDKDMPDLIMIDGGKGQLSAALRSLRELGLKIPTIALAKEEEEIYLPNTPEPLRLGKDSRVMLLLRSIRDSVHRFSLAYNRKRREMALREESKKTDQD